MDILESDSNDCAINSTIQDDIDRVNIRLAITVESGIGVLLYGIIIIILLCAKAYKTFLQRLFIWTVLTVLVEDSTRVTSIAINESALNNSNAYERGCEFIGFISVWSVWCVYTFFMVMIVYLLIIVCIQTRGNSNSTIVAVFTSSRVSRISLEVGSVLGSLLVPILVLWAPYYQQHYGFSGHLCGIKAKCSRQRREFTSLFFYVYASTELTGVFAIFTALGMTIVYCTLSSRLQHARHLIRKLIAFLLAMIAYIMITNLTAVMRITIQPGYQLAIFFVSVYSFGKFFLIVGYLVAFHFSRIHKALKKLAARKRKKCSNQQADRNIAEYGTFKESSRNTVPSSTFFNIPHTGEFTSV